MPHTNPWDTTSPPGTELAKNIDDHLRRLRLDITERLADIVDDPYADPLVLKNQFTGQKTGKQMVIPFSDFTCSTTGKEIIYGHGVLNGFSDCLVILAPIKLPPGVTITKVEMLMDVGDCTSINWWLYTRNFAAGGSRPSSQTANVIAAAVNQAGAGVKLTDTGALAMVVDSRT